MPPLSINTLNRCRVSRHQPAGFIATSYRHLFWKQTAGGHAGFPVVQLIRSEGTSRYIQRVDRSCPAGTILREARVRRGRGPRPAHGAGGSPAIGSAVTCPADSRKAEPTRVPHGVVERVEDCLAHVTRVATGSLSLRLGMRGSPERAAHVSVSSAWTLDVARRSGRRVPASPGLGLVRRSSRAVGLAVGPHGRGHPHLPPRREARRDGRPGRAPGDWEVHGLGVAVARRAGALALVLGRAQLP